MPRSSLERIQAVLGLGRMTKIAPRPHPMTVLIPPMEIEANARKE